MAEDDASAGREDHSGPRRRNPAWTVGMGCLVAFVAAFGLWLLWSAVVALVLLLAGTNGGR
jgi:type VI protein secretion system component VasF